MRALIYTRVSTDEQAQEGYSLLSQEQMCRQRAEQDNRPLVSLYCDDGYSAATLDRPEMQRMLGEMRRGDVVFCQRLDRLSRDVEHMAVLMKQFQRAGVTVHPLVGSADLTNSLGRAFVGVQSVFAQLEREQLGERVAVGMRQRVEQGKPYSRRPYGYVDTGDEWLIHEERANFVRLMARWRMEGHGFYTICRRLESMGVPGPQGKHWYAHVVKAMLANPVYIGRICWKGQPVPVDVPPIFDEVTWQRLQAVLEARRNAKSRPSSRYLLTGILRCECGWKMGGYVLRKKRRPDGRWYEYPHYKCNARSSVPATDHNNALVCHRLDALVLERVDAYLAGNAEAVVLPSQTGVKVKDRTADLDRELESLEHALLQGRITGERYDLHKRRIEKTRSELLRAAPDVDRPALMKQMLRQTRVRVGCLTERYRKDGVTPNFKAELHALVEKVVVSLGDGLQKGLDSRSVSIVLRGPVQ